MFGFAAGLPVSVWVFVAAASAALMLLYLYRQIALGKIGRCSGGRSTDNGKWKTEIRRDALCHWRPAIFHFQLSILNYFYERHFKNIGLAWFSTASTVFAAVETRDVLAIISAVVLPVVFFHVGKAIDGSGALAPETERRHLCRLPWTG